MQLKLRHLEVFNALIEAGSVSRAAERLNLTQPAVSIALGNLEAELGFRLFHRERGFFAATGEAMQLHAEVAQGLLAISRVEQRASEIRSGATGGVSIATNGALAINFLPRLVADFQAENPGISVEIRVHSSRQIAAWVSGRQIDIGLIDTPVPVAGLNAELFRLECVCVMRESDPLTALATVTPKSLAGRSVIAVTGDHMVDRQLDRLLSDASIKVERNASSYYFAIARNFVAAGNYVALVDPINGKAELSDGVTWRRFVPRVDHELAMITSKDQRLGGAAAAIHGRIRDGLNAAQ
ncbi:MAG: LysR substrate-binding domain-containing protein [Paracoccaceae bacterium]|nr:LysR substrate-binding domain-containing protein [Paracoccaceae bacterium]MDH5529807.1 LysR substrate-binding domain-containing protein [Paracoccaceae bacterium]